jgi:hypothetical protein
MNPGIADEVGQTSRSAIGALTGTPVVLALAILQIVTLSGVVFSIYNRQNATNAIIHKLIDVCNPPKAVLEQILPPNHTDGQVLP